jgi:hypothetical protein
VRLEFALHCIGKSVVPSARGDHYLEALPLERLLARPRAQVGKDVVARVIERKQDRDLGRATGR